MENPARQPCATRVHQPTDLSQQYRVVLDEARREGVARVRDKDGTSLLIVPEERISSVERDLTLARTVITAFVVCRGIDRALTAGQLPMDIDVEGCGFVRQFSSDDLAELRAELYDAAFRTWLDRDPDALQAAVVAWRTTAEVLRDELARAVLLGEVDQTDVVEVRRPE